MELGVFACALRTNVSYWCVLTAPLAHTIDLVLSQSNEAVRDLWPCQKSVSMVEFSLLRYFSWLAIAFFAFSLSIVYVRPDFAAFYRHKKRWTGYAMAQVHVNLHHTLFAWWKKDSLETNLHCGVPSVACLLARSYKLRVCSLEPEGLISRQLHKSYWIEFVNLGEHRWTFGLSFEIKELHLVI